MPRDTRPEIWDACMTKTGSKTALHTQTQRKTKIKSPSTSALIIFVFNFSRICTVQSTGGIRALSRVVKSHLAGLSVEAGGRGLPNGGRGAPDDARVCMRQPISQSTEPGNICNRVLG